MDKQPQSRAPLIVAIVLLVLPMLYVGSYLALVNPEFGYPGRTTVPGSGPCEAVPFEAKHYDSGYRNGGEWAWVVFWPLEQIDRLIRPNSWPPR